MPLDPVEQTLQQGRTQESSTNLADYYFKGITSDQQQQQINLSGQRLALEQQQQQNENAKQPGLLEHMRLTNINESVANQVQTLNLARLTQQNEAMPDLIKLQLGFQESPLGYSDPNFISQTRDLATKFPQAFVPGAPGSDIINAMKANVMQSNELNQIVAAQKRVQSVNPNMFVSHMGPQGISIGEKSGPSATADVQDIQQADKWQQQADATDDPQIKSRYQRNADLLRSKFAPKEDASSKDVNALMDAAAANDKAQGITKTPAELAQRRLDFTQDKVLPLGSQLTFKSPDGTTMTQQVGRQSKVTGDNPETQKLKEQSMGLTDTAKQIQTTILPNLENIYGPKSTLGNFVVDKGFSNLNPELAVGQRIAGREAAKYLYQGVLRQLNKGQRVNAQEQKQLEDTFPALNGLKGMHESPADAKAILQQLQKQVSRDAYLKQRMTGSRPDPETLQYLEPSFILDEVRAGRISVDEASNAFKTSAFQNDPLITEANQWLKKQP